MSSEKDRLRKEIEYLTTSSKTWVQQQLQSCQMVADMNNQNDSVDTFLPNSVPSGVGRMERHTALQEFILQPQGPQMLMTYRTALPLLLTRCINPATAPICCSTFILDRQTRDGNGTGLINQHKSLQAQTEEVLQKHTGSLQQQQQQPSNTLAVVTADQDEKVLLHDVVAASCNQSYALSPLFSVYIDDTAVKGLTSAACLPSSNRCHKYAASVAGKSKPLALVLSSANGSSCCASSSVDAVARPALSATKFSDVTVQSNGLFCPFVTSLCSNRQQPSFATASTAVFRKPESQTVHHLQDICLQRGVVLQQSETPAIALDKGRRPSKQLSSVTSQVERASDFHSFSTKTSCVPNELDIGGSKHIWSSVTDKFSTNDNPPLVKPRVDLRASIDALKVSNSLHIQAATATAIGKQYVSVLSNDFVKASQSVNHCKLNVSQNCSLREQGSNFGKPVVNSTQNTGEVSKYKLRKKPVSSPSATSITKSDVQMKVTAGVAQAKTELSRKVVLQHSMSSQLPTLLCCTHNELNTCSKRKMVNAGDILVSVNKNSLMGQQSLEPAAAIASRNLNSLKVGKTLPKIKCAVMPVLPLTKQNLPKRTHCQGSSGLHQSSEDVKRSANINSSLLSLNKYKLIKKRQTCLSPGYQVQHGLFANDAKKMVKNTNGLLSQNNRFKLVRRNSGGASKISSSVNLLAGDSTPIKSFSSQYVNGKPVQRRNSGLAHNGYRLMQRQIVCSSKLDPMPVKITPIRSSEISVVRTTKSGLEVAKTVSNKYKFVRRRSSGSCLNSVKADQSVKSTSSSSVSKASRSSSDNKPMFALGKYKLVQQHLMRRYSALFKFYRPSLSRLPDRCVTKGNIARSGVQRKPSSSLSACVRRPKSARSFVSKYALKRSPGDGIGFGVSRSFGQKMKRRSGSRYKIYSEMSVCNTNVYKTSGKRHQFPTKSQLKIDRRRLSARRRRLSYGHGPFVNRRGSWPTPAASRAKRLSWKKAEGAERNAMKFVKDVGSPLQVVASQLVQRSLHKLVVQRRRSSANVQKYCIYYNRFGRCNRGDKCSFIHDPDKVAVCTRYLRGTCKVDGCPFSHVVAPHKMPVCQYFLRGVCVRDSCPYLHVKVASDAEPCLDFATGVCSLGDECKKLHVLVCPDFIKTESCPRGSRCPMRHVKKKPKTERQQLEGGYYEACVKNSMRPEKGSNSCKKRNAGKKLPLNGSVRTKREVSSDDYDSDDVNLPMKQRRMPSFIALNSSDTTLGDTDLSTSCEQNKSGYVGTVGELIIRPRLEHPPSDDEDIAWMLQL